MARQFTGRDVVSHAGHGGIFAGPDDLIESPLPWQTAGLSQTASGYGAKLTSTRKILFKGRAYRLYVTQYANAGSTWFVARGRKIFVI
jgi:hypothetical protein